MFEPDDNPSPIIFLTHQLGMALGSQRLKAAAESEPVPSYDLAGVLYVSERTGKPYALLSVPNALVRGAFDALGAPGIELPLMEGKLDAHITIMDPDEIAQIGGPDALQNDRGKSFTYSIGRLLSWDPMGWPDVAQCFGFHVYSPQLQLLRKSYGLTALPKYPFHLSVAIRKKGVLGRNEKAKNTAAA